MKLLAAEVDRACEGLRPNTASRRAARSRARPTRGRCTRPWASIRRRRARRTRRCCGGPSREALNPINTLVDASNLSSLRSQPLRPLRPLPDLAPRDAAKGRPGRELRGHPEGRRQRGGYGRSWSTPDAPSATRAQIPPGPASRSRPAARSSTVYAPRPTAPLAWETVLDATGRP